MKFDLITVGQAFHWFENEKFICFAKSILKENGVLCILGYQKQHFKPEDSFYNIFQNFFEYIKPYFDCNADENDNFYLNSHNLFKNNFEFFDLKFFEEKIEINLDFLITLLKSWSAYNNFIKKKSEKEDDPLNNLITDFEKELRKKHVGKDNLLKEDIMKIKFDYYNFYFMITLKN